MLSVFGFLYDLVNTFTNKMVGFESLNIWRVSVILLLLSLATSF